MIIHNTVNNRKHEYHRIDDVHEDNIKPNKLNSTALEKYLVRVNSGKKRRQRNNHAERLARFKAK